MNTLKKITSLGALALTGVMATTGTAGAETAPLEHLNASTESAVVYVETTWSGRVFDTFKVHGEPYGYVRDKAFSVTSRCTGFVVNPDGQIVTAGHCVEYSDDIEAALIRQAAVWSYAQYDYDVSMKKWVKWAMEDFRVDGEQRQGRPDRTVETALGIALSGESTGSVQPARVLALRGFEKGDVALLKVEGENLPALELATESEIGVGTEVVSIGYPASVDLVTDATFDPSYKDGTISSIKSIDGNLLEVYEVSAPVSGGMSGGPTVDLEGRVVGLNSFGIRGESQPFNFIRPVSIIQEMLEDEGVTNELGDVQRAFQTGLDAYFAGDRTTAIASLDQVLAQVPSHEMAQQYRAKAEIMPEPVVVEDGGLPVLPIVAGVLLLLVAGGSVGAYLLVRRSGGPAVSTTFAPAGPTPPVTPTVSATTVTLPELQEVSVAAEQPTSSNGQRYCSGCGVKQSLGHRFCASCGTPAEAVHVG
jgi:serine protease Do